MKTVTRFGVEVEDVSDTKENLKNIYSQAHQDLFALGINDYKLNGTYVDIGCSMPRDCNNTYLLEQFGWTGVNVDIRGFEKMWEEHRTNKYYACDATKQDYKSLFKQFFGKIKNIDYLTFDIDSVSNIVLPMIPFDEYKFNCITIEHDIYTGTSEYKQLQHQILTKHGYKCLAENICVFEKHTYVPFEDWWVSSEIYEKYKNISIPKQNYFYSDEFLHYLGFFLNRNFLIENKHTLFKTKDIITGNMFKGLAAEYLDDDKKEISLLKKPKLIFLKTDWIEVFKQKVLPNINYPFKLITHNADRPCPSNNLDLLEDSRIIKWYGMNCQIKHPKLQPIPIGIANEKWPHGNREIILEIINTDILKTKLCYSNFEISTNPDKRTEIFNTIKTKSFIDTETHKLTFKEYLTKLKSYKYVISPPGNSIDCHRVWEAIYLGVIPIIEKHTAMEYFYDLPILVVNSFNDVTEELLINSYESIIVKSINKAEFIFYKNLIL